MVSEVLTFLQGKSLKVFYEGTVGAGGHAEAILEAHPEIGLYLACDQDPDALALARERLCPWQKKVKFIQGNFRDLDEHLHEEGIEQVDGFFLI